MNGKTSLTIPLLPCVSLDETLNFWQALGFTVTFQQRSPNAYAVMRYDDYELHFFGLKQLNPPDNFSTCLVIVPEVEPLHRTFAERLRESLGKVPVKGFPRITRMKPAQSRFTVTDVAGNSVIFIKRGGEDDAAANAYKKAGQTPLRRAIQVAARLRDFKGDDAAAAKVLDAALARPNQETALDYARALAARIELAVAMDDPEGARGWHAQFKQLSLSAIDRQALRDELAALNDLERARPLDGQP
ncbi:MAG: hypothetical protein H7Z75_01465 [Ferruginibacter sp.]|nr:hypothetical protein [Cytophagales bacterium]